jgi:ppGpp synthetase/RelA/SpoT-type nucleotidyltranferase
VDQERLKWFKEQVKGFVAVRATYNMLAKKLGQILEQARDRYAPMGRVDARAKSIASFAKKALPKCEKYRNPLERMTDLAGARIVVLSLDEARAVRHFIEHEPGFRIDWDNSRDVRRSIKTGEFGYNGVHYVVELCQAVILGVQVPPEIQSVAGKRSYKAEIQVHTALQNVWSTIGHDRLYKTQIEVPESLKREVHAVPARLESVDQAFARSIESLDRYIHHFEAYRRPADLQDDIDRWRAVHDEDPTDVEAVHQLGRCLMAAQQWEEAYETLKVLKDKRRADVQMDLGQSTWRARPLQVEEARGYLRKASVLAPDDWRVWCALANTYRSADVSQAIAHYEKAFAIDPDEPAMLSPLVECHIRRDRSLVGLRLMQGALGASRCQCHERAIRGVDVPQAHFNCARLYLYLGEPSAAMNSYCMAVATCHLPEMICDEQDALTAILGALAHGQELLASSDLIGFEWARRLMIVVLAAGASTWEARPDEQGAQAWMKAGEGHTGAASSAGHPCLGHQGSLPAAGCHCCRRVRSDGRGKAGRQVRQASGGSVRGFLGHDHQRRDNRRHQWDGRTARAVAGQQASEGCLPAEGRAPAQW